MSGLPIPTSDRAIGWWDYWIFRYQTLIAGVLAIFGAGFTIYAAKMSIWYDKKKVEQAADHHWRRSLSAVLSATQYAENVIISKRELIRVSTTFPDDVYPAILLETAILEQITANTLKETPSNVSMRCFHVAFSMQFANNMMNTNIGRKLVPSERERLQQGLLQHLQRTLLCTEIVAFQLKYLIKAPRDEWQEGDFDQVNWDLLQPLMKRWDVPRSEVEILMREIKIRIID